MDTTMTLINGDCLDILKSLQGESVDLTLTDPPYNLGNFMRERDTNLVKMRDNFFGNAGWDDLPFKEWVKSMDMFFSEQARILKKGGAIVVFTSLIRVETLMQIAEGNGFYYKTTGVWHKTNPMPRNMNLHFINSIEGWIYLVKEKRTGTFNNNASAIHDFIESSSTPKKEKKYGGHPTQKPEKVMQHFIELLSNPGEVVMDPFMGSGTTGVAAKSTGRSFVGIELQEEYFDIALKRIADVKTIYKCNEMILDGMELIS